VTAIAPQRRTIWGYSLPVRPTQSHGRVDVVTQVWRPDLNAADRIVALMETKHRPLIVERFSFWESRLDCWDVADIEITPPVSALKCIEARVTERLRVLS
jgi:hypothetical protein